jgi:hypothetical protein
MLVLYILSVPVLLCVLFLLAVSQRSGNASGVQPRSNASLLPPRPTPRAVRRDEPRGHQPSGRPVDWSKVTAPGTSAVRPPAHGYQPNLPDVDWTQTRPTAGTGAQVPQSQQLPSKPGEVIGSPIAPWPFGWIGAPRSAAADDVDGWPGTERPA